MSIRYGNHSTAARRIIALMGRRPRLKIERPGWKLRYHYSWEQYNSKDYQSWLAREKVRIAALSATPAADVKSQANHLHFLKPGTFFRLVDGHGKAYGKRYQRGVDDGCLQPTDSVRVVSRQEEDPHSQLSRMMKRAHRAAMKD